MAHDLALPTTSTDLVAQRGELGTRFGEIAFGLGDGLLARLRGGRTNLREPQLERVGTPLRLLGETLHVGALALRRRAVVLGRALCGFRLGEQLRDAQPLGRDAAPRVVDDLLVEPEPLGGLQAYDVPGAPSTIL